MSRDKKTREDEKSTIPSKKSSLNYLNKKTSKNDLSGLDFYNLNHKLTNNFIADTQEESRFEQDEMKYVVYHKQKKEKRDGESNDNIQKGNKSSKNTV